MNIWEKFITFLQRFDKSRIDSVTTFRPIDRDSWKYTEDGRSLIIHGERFHGAPEWVLYTSTIKHWLPPYDYIEINEDEKKRILQKIGHFLFDAGITYEIKW